MAKPLEFLRQHTCFNTPGVAHVPRGVDEAHTVDIEGAVHGEEDGQLSQRLNGTQQHDTDDDESDNERGRTARL